MNRADAEAEAAMAIFVLPEFGDRFTRKSKKGAEMARERSGI
jgi:hypothetical protein